MKKAIKIIIGIILLSVIDLSASTETRTFPVENTGKMIIIKKGNILNSQTQAIVNAANAALQAGGGVCGVIFDAAGYKKLQEACDTYPVINGVRCPTGEARITDSFNLQQQSPIQYIIHAVGPDCRIIKEPQEQNRLLEATYHNALLLAEKHHITSLAFPFLSSGIYQFEEKQAAKMAINTVVEYLVTTKNKSAVQEIHFVLYSQAAFDLFCTLLFQIPDLLHN